MHFRWQDLAGPVVSVKSVHYAYILLPDQKKRKNATVTVALILLKCAD